MRTALRILAVLLALLGGLTAAAGIVAAVFVGTDDTVPVVDQQISVSGVAWSTAPTFFTRYGATLHVTATSRQQRSAPIFVGVAPTFQIADYLKDKQRSELTELAGLGALAVKNIEGNRNVEPPGELDFWSVKSKGATEVRLAWPIPNGQNSVVIMRANGDPVGDIGLEAGVELKGLFATAVAVAGAGLLGIAVAVVIFVLTRRRRGTPTPEVVA